MKKKMVSVLLTASMLAGMTMCAVPVMAEDAETPENEVTGDASADDSFVVWGWNDDIKKILITIRANWILYLMILQMSYILT